MMNHYMLESIFLLKIAKEIEVLRPFSPILIIFTRMWFKLTMNFKSI